MLKQHIFDSIKLNEIVFIFNAEFILGGIEYEAKANMFNISINKTISY